MELRNTPVDVIEFLGHQVYVKRDDLLDVAFSGNKARKFYHFLQQDLSQVDILVGHGSAQANSLYSLSALAKIKQCQLYYYVDHLPQYLIDNPQGNYRAALELGANIMVTEPSEITVIEYIQQYVLPALTTQGQVAVFIPEGGRCQYAETGLKILADEIMAWAESNSYADIRVVLPAGTGTTALFLQKHLPFEVQTCACVGGDGYLKQQFSELCADESLHPTIMTADKKYHFGKLYLAFYHIWAQLKQTTNIEFDLLYDPLAWLCLQREFSIANENSAVGLESSDNRPILYIHQGGLQGNETMLPRYLRKLAFVK
ncbi:MAG: 1-aminocyclopropane-1-carboxylate deaminase/D-cysteine desulfhydrase [Moritella sp.]|uniref:1-aminocyclopropane-1-carboxylate deaminase/D-cysteine desulfhydrase n=1 Tax=Moritella sp. TaxID=78556 RepID=UPI0029B505CC|nr:1-aminocyclopropane-1-carboxylate deaminase/D-cysteine desulfhydrase [Moritella sp.]MDX2322448.1 1-aminocyclopropane-1-carboxylate deaminase/D-cysteine desulfhydrase [Moritella sp.]